MRNLRIALTILVGVFVGCVHAVPNAPPPPNYGLMEFPAPYSFTQWWGTVERCSGLRGDLGSLRFFVAPKPILTLPDDPGLYAGMYFPGDKRIVLGLFEPSDSAVVMHEMLHALLDANGQRAGDNQHPPHYFHELCGKVLATPFGT